MLCLKLSAAQDKIISSILCMYLSVHLYVLFKFFVTCTYVLDLVSENCQPWFLLIDWFSAVYGHNLPQTDERLDNLFLNYYLREGKFLVTVIVVPL